MRWLIPLSTILPAAARLCGSSSLWRLIPARGGGAAHKVRQVKLAPTQWVAVEREKRAFWGPPLSCLLSAHLGMCLLSCSLLRGRQSFVPHSLCITPFLTQWGSILMMGEWQSYGRSPPPFVPSKTLKEPLRDVLSPFDNHSHFSFWQSSLFSPLFLHPSQNCWENIAVFNLSFLTDDLVNIQRKITPKNIYSWLFVSYCFGYKYPSRDSNKVSFENITGCLHANLKQQQISRP